MATLEEVIRKSGYDAAEHMPRTMLADIGELIVRWSYVEFQLGVLLREGFQIPAHTGRAIITGAELGVLCGQMRTLAHSERWIQDKAIRGDIDKLSKDIRRHSDGRHDYAHGVFTLRLREVEGKDEWYIVRIVQDGPKNRDRPVDEPITRKLLHGLCDQAKAFGIRAQNLTVRVKEWKVSAGLQPRNALRALRNP